MLPSFWTLLNGEREGGVTVHYMNPGIDDGPIIEQRRFAIHPDDTVDTLIRRSKAVGAELLADVLGKLRTGTITTRPNNPAEGTYYSFPTRKDVSRLRALGRAVV
jgi:methionyl-tRNA formyltransferase